MNLRRFLPLLLLVAAVTLVLLPYQDAEARRGFSGFGRSSLRLGGSSFARKATVGRRSIGWGRASVRRRSAAGAASGRAAGWSGGNIERRVGTRGKAFGSRREANAAYRKGLKTRWKSKPAKRPEYVPKSISRDGRRYDVVFNNGRYGYWGPGGAWVALGAGSMLASGAGQGYGYRDPARAGAWPAFLGTLGLFALVVMLSRRGGRC